MSEIATLKPQAPTRAAADVVRATQVAQAANGICFAAAGETSLAQPELERIIAAVPRSIAAALEKTAYYFVPLTLGEGEETLVVERYDVALSDRAVCHCNYDAGGAQCVFISTRLMDDKFSVAFEFYINVGHAFVERAGVAEEFCEVAWKQAQENVRGETSLDAYEYRKLACSQGSDAEKAKNGFFNAAFADSIAIYLLSLYLDVDYYDLREREYPLLAPAALAERLRKMHALFPPPTGYEFSIVNRRRP